MSRKLRTAKLCDLIYIEEALKRLHSARRFIAMVGANKTKAKISSAIKSAEGAHRHTLRCLPLPDAERPIRVRVRRFHRRVQLTQQ